MTAPPAGPGRGRRRDRRRLDARGRRAAARAAADAAGHLPVRRGRGSWACSAPRAFLEHDPLAGRGRHRGQPRSARRHRAGDHVRDQPAERRRRSPRSAAARRRPVANSLSTDLYRLIPNSTDVTVFAERPWTILNFAMIGNETRYHSAGDTLAALDRRSLQHMGDAGAGGGAARRHPAAPPAAERRAALYRPAGRVLVGCR